MNSQLLIYHKDKYDEPRLSKWGPNHWRAFEPMKNGFIEVTAGKGKNRGLEINVIDESGDMSVTVHRNDSCRDGSVQYRMLLEKANASEVIAALRRIVDHLCEKFPDHHAFS